MPQDERGKLDDDPGAGPDGLDMLDDGESRFSMMTGTLVVLGVVTLAVFAGVIWYAYKAGSNQAQTGAPAVVMAEEGESKQKPEDPGGANFAHQDKTVYNKIDGASEDIEQLLPGSEEPMEKPRIISPSTEDLPPAGQPKIVRIPDSGSVTAPPPPEVEAPEITDPMAGARDKNAGNDAASATGAEDMPVAPEQAPEIAAVGEAAKAPEAVAQVEAPAPVDAPADETRPAMGSGAFVLQLGAFRTQEAAVAGWKLLTSKHAAILDGLTQAVSEADLGEKGKFYRLQAGPFTDRAAASGKCTALKNAGANCLVVAR